MLPTTQILKDYMLLLPWNCSRKNLDLDFDA